VRVGDRRLLKLIEQWLTAGVVDEGEWLPGELGTPQGSVISPLLANVFLHYVLDCWVDAWRQSCRGDVIIVRYADDFVMGFQSEREARRCWQALQARMAEFGLTLHPEKTRLIEFGRFAEQQRRQRGESRPEPFNFLGFTHYCGTTRTGRFKIGRQPIAARLRATLHKLKEELRKRRHDPVAETGQWLRSVVRGWMNYFAVPGTSSVLNEFVTQVERLWLRQLRRRSQRGSRYQWSAFRKLSARWIPRPKIVHPYPDQRLRGTTRDKSRMK
jgi:group II intron reverse transcriptase/maturase